VQELRGWGERASRVNTCSEEFWALIEEGDLDWIYIKEGIGALQPMELAGCEEIEEVYANPRIKIYQIVAE